MKTIGQLLAMRASPRNIIGRSALWYRLERIGEEPQQVVEVNKQPFPEPEWSKGQWDYVQQIKSRLLHLETKVYKHLHPESPRITKRDSL